MLVLNNRNLFIFLNLFDMNTCFIKKYKRFCEHNIGIQPEFTSDGM